MTVTAVRLGGRPDLPLLVLGPSLGTSVTALWSAAARLLSEDFQVVGWDLPGHGTNRLAYDGPVSVASLAADVLAMVDAASDALTPPPFHYAGDSVGGAVGLRLALTAPDRVASATLLCTGARIGDDAMWEERVADLRAGGTEGLVEATVDRWFGPGFVDREPERVEALLQSLREVDDDGYAAVCDALAGHDLRDRLAEVRPRVLAVAGADDRVTPTAGLAEVAEGVQEGRLVVLEGVAHLAPAEAPEEVARLVAEHAGREARPRTGIDARSRSMVALAALVAAGRVHGLEAQLRRARAAGLTLDDVTEVLRLTAEHGGVGTDEALRTAREVYASLPGSAG